MAASYPSAIKTFTTKTENDLVMEDHVNDVQNEITAEQTELGTLPKGGYADVKTRLDAAAMAMSAHFLIPCLRSYWSCSAITYVSSVVYVVAPYNNGFNLTNSSATPAKFGYTGIAPWVEMNGITSYLTYADHQNFDITGTEAHISEPGLALGSMVRFTNAAGSIEAIFGKRNTAGNQRSYSLRRLANGTLEFCISVDGTAEQSVVTTTVTAQNVWYHIAGVFDPSTRLSIFLNGVEEGVLTAAVSASIYNSTAILCAGAEGAGATNLLTGRLSQIWIAASNLGVTYPLHLFNQTRGLFGV